jgi:uncharacterized protein YndB with AHSA1/START domain
MKNEPIVFERTFDAPVEKVWKAITDKNEMKKWYFDMADFKPELGAEFSFEGGKDDRVYVHLCQITELVPKKILSYSWRYRGYDGISFLHFELFPEGNSTRLKLTHEGLESFPANNPDFASDNFRAGWNEIVNVSLKKYLEESKEKVKSQN